MRIDNPYLEGKNKSGFGLVQQDSCTANRDLGETTESDDFFYTTISARISDGKFGCPVLFGQETHTPSPVEP